MRKPDFMPILLALLLAGLCLSNLAGCAGKDKDVSSPNTEQNAGPRTCPFGHKPSRTRRPGGRTSDRG